MTYGTDVAAQDRATPDHVPAELLRDFDHHHDPEFLRDPFEYLEKLRGHTFFSTAWGGFWVPTEPDDIREAFQRHDLFTNFPGGLPAREASLPMIPEELDPPDHTKYRRAISGMFAPKAVKELEDEIRGLARQLVAEAKTKGSIDFVEDFAVPLPTRVFMGRLGLPLDQADLFVQWNNTLLHALGEEKKAANIEVGKYLTDLVAERAANPQDDWISELLAAEVDGAPMAQSDVVGIVFLFFLAGLETVTAGLTFSFRYLASSPEHRAELAEDPEMAPQAVEELLRYFSFTNIPRRVIHDVEFAGVQMKAGDQVLLCNSLVSRSPEENEDADLVDFQRAVSRHSAFGMGPHRCLGSHLARLEMAAALEEWHREIPDYEIVPGSTIELWGGTNMAIKHLPLQWQ
ncbi:MAG: cytochrome P450 [Leifsonia flava]